MRKTMMLALRQKLTISRTTLPKLISHAARAAAVATVALPLCLGFPHTGQAGQYVLTGIDFSPDDDSMERIEIFHDKDDWKSLFVLIYYKDGSVHGFTLDNPSPDNPKGDGKGDLKSLIALAKQKGSEFTADADFWKTPLGQQIGAGGGGPAPVINPSDDEGSKGGARNPSIGKQNLGGPQIFNKFGQMGSGHGGFQFNGGSPADQLKTHGPGSPPGGGSNNGNGDDKGSHKPPPGSNYGPAELVDPLGPPIAKGATRIPLKGVKTAGRLQNVGAGLSHTAHNTLGRLATKTPKASMASTTTLTKVRPGLTSIGGGIGGLR